MACHPCFSTTISYMMQQSWRKAWACVPLHSSCQRMVFRPFLRHFQVQAKRSMGTSYRSAPRWLLPIAHPLSLMPVRRFAKKPADAMHVFDRDVKRIQRDVAAGSSDYDYLRNEVTDRVIDRLQDIKRSFPVIVDVGSGVAALLRHAEVLKSKGVQRIVHIDLSQKMLDRDKHLIQNSPFQHDFITGDVETPLLPDRSADAVLSVLSAHWVNDLPLMLDSFRRILKPDGVFMCAMLGGDTLQELRSAFAIADLERRGGVSPHVSPFVRMSDAGSLLSSSSLALPTVDWDVITVRYPDMFTLMHHLQAMGEQNAVLARETNVSRDIFLAAAAAYQEMYQDEQGLLLCTFQVLYMIGWAPDKSQPAPLQRGTAQFSIKDMEKLQKVQSTLEAERVMDATSSKSSPSPGNAAKPDKSATGASGDDKVAR